MHFCIILAKAETLYFQLVFTTKGSGFHRADNFCEIIKLELWIYLGPFRKYPSIQYRVSIFSCAIPQNRPP
jgi:hypothetical protein